MADGYIFSGRVALIEQLYDQNPDQALEFREHLLFEVATEFAPAWMKDHLHRLMELGEDDE